MFGMSWTQIILIVVIGVFLLGPERIPTAVQWVTGSLKKARGMAQGAQQQLNSELGPEIAEMRRQIAELQGLKEMQSLKELKDLNPRSMITKTIFGTDEARTAGGVAGLLGLDPSLLTDPSAKPVSAGGPADVTARAAQADAVSFDKGSTPGPTTSDPLPLVGGDQEKVQPAPEPDPMPQVGASVDAVPAHDPVPAPGLAPDPVPVQPPPVESHKSDPIPFAAAPAAAAAPAPDPLPAASAPTEPASAPTAAPTSDPLPVAGAPRAPSAIRSSARPPVQLPLVIGGDPLPRIAKPDPIPTAGS